MHLQSLRAEELRQNLVAVQRTHISERVSERRGSAEIAEALGGGGDTGVDRVRIHAAGAVEGERGERLVFPDRRAGGDPVIVEIGERARGLKSIS